jgi:hypothetical protein
MRGRRPLLAGAGILAVLWVSWVAYTLTGARTELESGRNALERLSALSSSEVLSDRSGELVDEAIDHLAAADRSLGSALVAPMRLVPGVGRHLDVVRHDAAAVRAVLEPAREVAAAAGALGQARTGADRLGAVERLAAGLRATEAALPSEPLTDVGPLLGPVAEAHGSLGARLDDLASRVTEDAAAAEGLASLMRGPSTILLLGANNAEMRAGHGTILSWGLVDVVGGDVSVRSIDPIATFPAPPGALIVDPDVAALWGWTNLANPANLGLSGRADATLTALGRRYQAATGVVPDAVVLADSLAVSRLAEQAGPLTIDGLFGPVPLEADEVTDYLLHDQYAAITDFGDLGPNPARRDATASLATTILERLVEGEADNADILDAFQDVIGGRHVLAVSDSPDLTSTWTALGVSAVLAPDQAVVGVVNAGANKADQYVATDVDVASPAAGVVDVAVTITNDQPALDLPYVVGLLPEGTPPGSYATLVSFTLPVDATGAQAIGLPPGAVLVVNGTEARRPVVGIRVDIPRLTATTITVRFTTSSPTVRFVPTARSPRTEWSVDGEPVDRDGIVLPVATGP